MRWIYVLCWVALAAYDVPRLRRAQEWRVLALWLTLALTGAVLSAWLFWGHGQGYLAEGMLGVRS